MIFIIAKWITVLALFFLTYQDFKYRAISWWALIPVLVYPIVCANITIKNVGFSISFLIIQLGITYLYFSFKGISIQNFFKNYIGVGDLLFFLLLAFYFSILNFVIFFNLSLLFSLVFYYIYKLAFKIESEQIPLAGLQALCLVGVILLIENRYYDDWIYNWIN